MRKKAGKRRNGKVSALETQRNRIRGAIAAGKSTRVTIARGKGVSSAEKASNFQRSLATVLIQSRKALGVSQFEGFLSWLEAQTTTQVAALSGMGALTSELRREVLASHPLPLPKELLWIALRLSHHATFLADYVQAKRDLEATYWRGKWPDIKDRLVSLETRFGRTLWALEARICLEQEFVGLEAQKKTAVAERKFGARTLSAFVAHYLSVRNEPTTVLRRHFDELGVRLARMGRSEPLRSYLRFLLLDGESLTEHEISQVLQIGQSLSEIDLYEALLGVAQFLVVNGGSTDCKTALTHSLERLRIVGDPRVDKLLVRLSEPRQPDAGRTQTQTLRRATHELRRNPGSVSAAIHIAGYLRRVREPDAAGRRGSRWAHVARLVARVLQYSSTYESDLDLLEKYFRNHRIFASAPSYLTALRGELTIDPIEAAKYRHQALHIAGESQGPASAALLPDPQGLQKTPRPRWIEVRTVLSDLHAATGRRDIPFIIAETTRLFLNGVVPLSALPLDSALGGKRWRDLKAYRHLLCLPIALHLCWRATDSDLAATSIRFAYDEFLDVHNVENAADLVAHREKFDRSELIYFLRHVCVPGFTDMSRRIPSSRAVEEQRRNLCSALLEIDPEHRLDYEAEIVGIVRSLSLQEGRTVVDSSRVHVDTGALRAWARRELEPSFRRYEALVGAGVGIAEDLEALIRPSRSTAQTAALLEVPESEADNVFIEMMRQLRDRFLVDPQHGLDSYLSRRVRHHSMTGYLRGPVEEAKLITSRNAKTNRYVENTHWTSRLSNHISANRTRVARCFESFSEDFDAIVLRLKNELFHVKGPEFPKGLFEIPISAPVIHIARSATQSDMALDTFCSVCFSLFWTGLDSSLKAAKSYLLNETKRELSATFQRLKVALRKAVDDTDQYADATIAIGTASQSIQREIDKMSEWFIRKEIQQTTQPYSMEKMLDIAIASAIASNRPFAPEIAKAIDCRHQFRAGDLITVAEIVLTALGNVKDYAATGDHPEVRIVVRVDDSKKSLVLRIENRVGKSARSRQALDRVDRIREQIRDGSYVEKIRSEGGSGLMKIAASAGLGDPMAGSVEFGFMGEDWFFMEKRLTIIEQDIGADGGRVGRLVG